MATSIANYYCLLSRCSGMIRSIALTGQLGSKCVRNRNLFRRCFYPSLSYGSRAADGTQDGQVDVPVDRLTISYSRSSGPGGQNVNKVSTKAEVRFHVRRADWIPEDVKQKIILKNKNRINKAGELLVTSELSRNQQRNLGDCIQKISDIIAEASEKPHEPSTEDIALRASRLERRNQERLKQKKIQSAIKQTRRVDFD